MLIRAAEIEGRAGLDVRIEGERIAAVASGLSPRPGETVLDARGGALLPGLHDHHVHLRSLAAAGESVACGPPEVRDERGLAAALASAEPTAAWIRGVGYHESVAGTLDRARLDALAPGRRVRIQHRSGALWMLSSAALAAVGIDGDAGPPGSERDGAGRPTGRLFDADAWLRDRLPPAPPPDWERLGRALARCGVTGATDATPSNREAELRAFEEAVASGALHQRLLVMGSETLPLPSHPRVARGAVKLMLHERSLPAFDALVAAIERAHDTGRGAALHCVTRMEVLLATAALASAGCRPGDRLEHASVATPDAVKAMADLPLTVVTQPGFLATRGDVYAEEVDPEDLPWLYRGRGFRDAGVPLAAGTDAPFGSPDPWLAMRAAVTRESAGGRVLGAAEALSPEQALGLFTAPAEAPGGPPRPVRAGEIADLCLLDRPWRAARQILANDLVAATLCAGRLVWRVA